MVRDREVYNDWGGGPQIPALGHAYAGQFRERLQRGVAGDAPATASAAGWPSAPSQTLKPWPSDAPKPPGLADAGDASTNPALARPHLASAESPFAL